MSQLPELMTAREVAEALRVDITTVHRWTRDKKIGSVRLGPRIVRIPRADVERLLSEFIAAPAAAVPTEAGAA